MEEAKYNLEDIDVEVRHPVVILNKIRGVATTGCCCGHGHSFLYIDAMFSDIYTLGEFTRVISNNFRDSLQITTYDKSYQRGDLPQLRLRTLDGIVGDQAYRTINNFIMALEDLYNL